ncbi:hypothetical protein [Saccharothrix xinjiangensis]|uniref:Uncharacterized protein n=1 Tax=Saccharothrix xinjiangensis TaxID=204798 RepID=A0ABV9YF46_9PSEU
MTEHDFTLAYRRQRLGPVAEGFTRHEDRETRTTTVTGRCPRCQGPTTTEYPWGAPGTGTKSLFFRKKQEEPPDLLYSEPLFCECGYAHDGMPADAVLRGCGAEWRVERPEGDS